MLSLTKDKTFTEFKSDFYKTFTDLRDFNCQDFNLLKVVLDGLKVNYFQKKWVNHFIFKPISFQKIILILRKSEEPKSHLVNSNFKYLLFDNGKAIIDSIGISHSYYFKNIEDVLDKKKCFTIFQNQNHFAKENSLSFSELQSFFEYENYTKEEVELIRDLRKVVTKLISKYDLKKVDAINIKTACCIFFFQYRVFNRYFKISNYTYCFYDQHYHREGFILAQKRNNIKSIELQHGLIAEQDIFYVFPKPIEAIREKALFPDKLLCYGQYWINILNKGYEFLPQQLEIIGLYQLTSSEITINQKNELEAFLKDSQFILITTQTFLHNEFIKYVEWLSKDLEQKKSNFKIIVKNHPSENINLYENISKLGNCKIFNINVEYLLENCTYHVSIYSTTLYDALKYSCLNFALKSPSNMDYVLGITENGVAIPIEFNQNPVDINSKDNNKINSLFFYEDFNMHKHKLLS